MTLRVSQARLAEPPALFGANRLARMKIEVAQKPSLADVAVIVDDAVDDLTSEADPFPQYVANDPALRT